MVARLTGVSLGLFAFAVSVTTGLVSRNSVASVLRIFASCSTHCSITLILMSFSMLAVSLLNLTLTSLDNRSVVLVFMFA